MDWKLTTTKNLKSDAADGGWWRYKQNNSGGSFDTDGGLETWVWARGSSQADAIAESHGIYFDGRAKGHDCSCCGDRWYPAWSDSPDLDDRPIEKLIEHLTTGGKQSALAYAFSWKLGIRIIDKDGNIHWLKEKTKGKK